jgi:hypothetical protein
MTTVDERIRDLPYCNARLGEPCNIEQVCKELIAKLERLPSTEDLDNSQPYGLWAAHHRHNCTNYDEIVAELPGCWVCDDSGEPCQARLSAYLAIKFAANDL